MGFINNIKHIANSTVTEISQGSMICCLITCDVILVKYHAWTLGSYVSTLSACAIFIIWLLWVLYKTLFRKNIKEMPPKSRNVLEWVNATLFILLGVIYIFPSTSGLWMIWLSWFVFVSALGYAIRNRS